MSTIPPEIRFNRLLRMVGPQKLETLRNTVVTVVGIGAVGSFAVEALARSAVGHLRLVDFDIVCPSNINRQLIALESTLNRKKTEVIRERVLDINPDCVVETLDLCVDSQHTSPIFEKRSDVILDAIDLLPGKTALISEAVRRGIPLVSSMGAARRQDPTLIRTTTLPHVTGCPLARALRRELKKADIPMDSIECVYSIEPPQTPSAENTKSTDASLSPKAPLPSSIMVTGCFGLNLAHLAIRKILAFQNG
ncbi:MAG: tRNA threonylcarbamoyladenosine dehydratase [Verrucomicrobia bacterium]|nr:tRNA threonylcarbamoyladenosine dehydratase [Verrucomicrobiota bacterium]